MTVILKSVKCFSVTPFHKKKYNFIAYISSLFQDFTGLGPSNDTFINALFICVLIIHLFYLFIIYLFIHLILIDLFV